jgi:hypothetical protein
MGLNVELVREIRKAYKTLVRKPDETACMGSTHMPIWQNDSKLCEISGSQGYEYKCGSLSSGPLCRVVW